MVYTCRDVCNHIDAFAPPSFALEGDPIGLHLGSFGRSVGRLFLALELTPEVAAEALECSPDMIFVHHTPFFKPFKRLCDDDGHERIVIELIRRGVALYTAHTNLDCVRGGVNDALATRLGLVRTEVLQPLNQNVAEAGLGRIGFLESPQSLGEFVLNADKVLAAGGIRYCGDKEQRVHKIAVCGGAGAFLMGEALARGAEAFVTSDVKHHEGVRAMELGLALIDGGHFATENPVIPVVADYLAEKMPGLELILSAVDANPFNCI